MYLFPVLFTKLDNYSECEAGWPATKPIELLSGRTYRLVESCQRSAKGGQRIGPSRRATVRAFFFRRFYLGGGGWSYWNNLFTGNSLHAAHSSLLFSLPSFYDTHTHTHMQRVTGKNWGLWKRAKPELSEAPMAQCILKHRGVTDAVPSWERLAEAQTLLGALFQMTTKRKKVSVESVGPAVFFTPDECGSLGADTLCFSVGPGYGAVPEHWSTILLSVQKSLLCTAKEKRRLRGIFLVFFPLF